MKSISFSDHAKLQMILRGAKEEEVTITIRSGKWEAAKMGKLQTKHQFDFNKASLTNKIFYKYKTIEPVFADESNEIVVVTVKVYYSNEEVKL